MSGLTLVWYEETPVCLSPVVLGGPTIPRSGVRGVGWDREGVRPSPIVSSTSGEGTDPVTRRVEFYRYKGSCVKFWIETHW